jgi:Formyl transferase
MQPASNNTTEEKIRVVLLCNGLSFEAWEAAAIRQVTELPFVELVLIVENNNTASGATLKQPLHYPWRNFFWRIYKRKRLSKIDAVQLVDLSDELERLPRIKTITSLKGKYSEFFPEETIARIREAKADVILRFGFNIIRGEILTAARYGVWSYHHGDEQQFRGGPPGFWEMVRGVTVTGAILQRLTEKLDSGIVLRKGYFPTIRKSYRAQLNQLLNGTSSWMMQSLVDLHNGITAPLEAAPVSSQAKITTYPVNIRFVLAVIQQSFAALRFHYGELFRHEIWHTGIVQQSITNITENGITAPITWIVPADKNDFYADPFGGVDAEGNELILCEHFNYKTGKGVIARINRNGNAEEWLEREHHLSYPFMFRVGEEQMLLPESHENYNVSLRYANNPGKTVMHLLHGVPAVDSSVVEYNGKFWMFCTREDDGANISLHIYYAENSDSTFEPHAANPVKTDVRSSRPGGTPFVHNGKLYRPAQDCSTDYGAAIVINEVTLLTPTEFSEREVQRIAPQQSWTCNKGLHTLSVLNENETLIDAKKYVFNTAQFRRVLRRKISRFFSR